MSLTFTTTSTTNKICLTPLGFKSGLAEREDRMIIQIVSVRDRAAEAYGRPVFVNALGQAIRSFQDEINRAAPDNEMHKHPKDFDLYHLGTFDDQTGKITSLDHPHQLATGSQLTQEN